MKSKDLTIKKIKLSDLKENPINPKKHWSEGIEQSIDDLGYLDPIEVDENNVILAGHGRLKALKAKGYEDVPVIVHTGLTAKQKKKYLLVNNQLAIRGGYVNDLLKDNFSVEELLEAGFEEEQLSFLFDENAETEDDEFDVEASRKKHAKPDAKRGDVYQLGEHRLMCGDSQNSADVAILVGKNKIDMVYCDPPYNIGLNYTKGANTGPKQKIKKNYRDGKATYDNDKRKDDDYSTFLAKTMQCALEVAKPNTHFFYWCDERYIWLLQTLYEEAKIENRRVCLWIKNNFSLTPGIAFNKAYEACVYGTIGSPYLSPLSKNLQEIINKEVGSGNQSFDDIKEIFNLWLVSRDPAQTYKHPTTKPITLHEKPIKRCTRPGDRILDLFSGSASTLMACEQLDRRCYTMEIDPVFVQVGIERWETYTGKQAKKI